MASAGFSVATNNYLIRSNIWSRQIKELLLDELNAMKFVKIITDFPDGSTLNIPSLGEAETADFSEGKAVRYTQMNTGNFTFSFDQYKYSANSITEKFKRDSYYASDVIAAFVPRQHRALMEAVETRILSIGANGSGQTASSTDQINGADHRWVGLGTASNGGSVITFQDFAKAHYSLFKANVPLTNLVAIVDPSVAYTLQTQANAVNVLSPMPMWEDVIKSGAVTGFKFRFNIYGFDVYISNYLATAGGATGTGSETIGSKSVTTGVVNMLFSAAPGDTLPIIGGFHQMPTVYSEFNKDLQQEEYLTIAEYGFKTYRPENMICVLTDTNVIV